MKKSIFIVSILLLILLYFVCNREENSNKNNHEITIEEYENYKLNYKKLSSIKDSLQNLKFFILPQQVIENDKVIYPYAIYTILSIDIQPKLSLLLKYQHTTSYKDFNLDEFKFKVDSTTSSPYLKLKFKSNEIKEFKNIRKNDISTLNFNLKNILENPLEYHDEIVVYNNEGKDLLTYYPSIKITETKSDDE